MADANVKLAINDLITKWAEVTGDNAAICGVGYVEMWVPVDKTSKIVVPIPGRIIRHLGFTEDKVDASISKVFKADSDDSDGAAGTPPDGGVDSTGTYRKKPKGYILGKKIHTRLIRIPLKTPIPYTRDSKAVKLSVVSMRFPAIVSLNCIKYFLYQHSSTEKRPSFFYTDYMRFPIGPVPVTELGELSNKVEDPETEQTDSDNQPLFDKAQGGEPKKSTATTP